MSSKEHDFIFRQPLKISKTSDAHNLDVQSNISAFDVRSSNDIVHSPIQQNDEITCVGLFVFVCVSICFICFAQIRTQYFQKHTHTHNIERDKPLTKCKMGLIITAAGIGNFLEWFDFALFGLLANEIGENFFPSSDVNTHLLEAFSVNLVGFLMRPLGGYNILTCCIFYFFFCFFFWFCLHTDTQINNPPK